jgi:agmatine deiminase
VVVSLPNDRNHPDWSTLEENRQRLSRCGFEVRPLPIPELEWNDDIESYLPKGYVNFYLVNGAVLVPEFQVPEDALAQRVLAAAFPDRELVALDCRQLVFGQGSIHCLTQQLPRVR